jgi:hypothetical protein
VTGASSERETQAALALVDAGSEIAGAAAGGALGLLGGPPGVAAGAMGGVLVTRGLKRVAAEIHERVMAPRSRLRSAAAFTYAADAISARLLAGDVPRTDGFFEERPGDRPPSEELLEGVLLKAADEHEEKKLRYIGFLYASVAFDDRVDAGYANYLLRLASGLTFEQLMCLVLVERGKFDHDLRAIDAARDTDRAGVHLGRGPVPYTEHVLVQLMDLAQTGLVGIAQPDGRAVSPNATYGGGDAFSLRLTELRRTTLGFDLARLMRLEQIPPGELRGLLAAMGA